MADVRNSDLTNVSEMPSVSEFEAKAGFEESAGNGLELTNTDLLSHAVIGSLAFDLDQSTLAEKSLAESQTPSDDADADGAELLHQGHSEVSDQTIDVMRKVRTVWLIIFGSITSVFCFPFGVIGLIFAVYSWRLETSKDSKQRIKADLFAKISLIVSMTGVVVGTITAITFIILGLIWSS